MLESFSSAMASLIAAHRDESTCLRVHRDIYPLASRIAREWSPEHCYQWQGRYSSVHCAVGPCSFNGLIVALHLGRNDRIADTETPVAIAEADPRLTLVNTEDDADEHFSRRIITYEWESGPRWGNDQRPKLVVQIHPEHSTYFRVEPTGETKPVYRLECGNEPVAAE